MAMWRLYEQPGHRLECFVMAEQPDSIARLHTAGYTAARFTGETERTG